MSLVGRLLRMKKAF